MPTTSVFRLRAVSAVATGVMGASLLGAGLAQADAPDPSGMFPDAPASQNSEQAPEQAPESLAAAPHKPYGTVVSRSGLNVRDHPTTHSKVTGFLKYKQKVGIACKTRSQNVGGNRIWYKLRSHGHNWVSARYVKNTGQARWCKVTRAEQEAVNDAADVAAPKG